MEIAAAVLRCLRTQIHLPAVCIFEIPRDDCVFHLSPLFLADIGYEGRNCSTYRSLAKVDEPKTIQETFSLEFRRSEFEFHFSVLKL